MNTQQSERLTVPGDSRLRFLLSELSGSVGDLGITLPLAFALVVVNGFPAARIFLLWGIVYFLTGWFYRVPVAVQPLKAMAVIAITAGFTVDFLASTSFFYGALFLILAILGVIRWLERWFTPAVVRGVQLGLGLLLAMKAVQLIGAHGLFLGEEGGVDPAAVGLAVGSLVVLIVGQAVWHKPVAVFVLAAGLLVGSFLDVEPTVLPAGSPIQFTLPSWSALGNIMILLILPQLPLTLGNAVFAANDACHQFWPQRSGRVTAGRLATSIGLSNVGIGLLGGFPVCHGAGGMAAHARFGGQTGLTTMILGVIFIVVALVDDWSAIFFRIPVPILGSLLLLTGWSLARLYLRLPGWPERIVALLIGGIAFGTRHLTLALLVGLVVERLLYWRLTGNFQMILPAQGDDDGPAAERQTHDRC